jgi:hypothetical protein
MISRIMLSLRKAADKMKDGWSLGEPTITTTDLQSLNFFRQGKGFDTKDDIPVDMYFESCSRNGSLVL